MINLYHILWQELNAEPDAKKGPGLPPPTQGPPPLGRPPNPGGMGSGNGQHSEDMKVPDKMVGLSK